MYNTENDYGAVKAYRPSDYPLAFTLGNVTAQKGSPNHNRLIRIGELVGHIAETTESPICGYLPANALNR